MFNVVSNLITQLVEDKAKTTGESLLFQLLNLSGLGDVIRTEQRLNLFLQSGGSSEVDQLILKWFGLFRVSPLPESRLFERIYRFLEMGRAKKRSQKWQLTDWATSRQQWIEDRWQHDWRSQPRNPAGGQFHWSGAWIPGRLPYPVVSFKAARTIRHLGRARKRQRRWRSMGKSVAKGVIQSSWADN